MNFKNMYNMKYFYDTHFFTTLKTKFRKVDFNESKIIYDPYKTLEEQNHDPNAIIINNISSLSTILKENYELYETAKYSILNNDMIEQFLRQNIIPTILCRPITTYIYIHNISLLYSYPYQHTILPVIIYLSKTIPTIIRIENNLEYNYFHAQAIIKICKKNCFFINTFKDIESRFIKKTKNIQSMCWDIDIKPITLCEYQELESTDISFKAQQIKSLDTNPQDCPICYEEKSDTILQCGHTYCQNCILRIAVCSVCRKEILERPVSFVKRDNLTSLVKFILDHSEDTFIIQHEYFDYFYNKYKFSNLAS